MMGVTAELEALAEILAQWVDEIPGVPAVYLFGSRVRGDHRPDSDVDVRLYLDEWFPNTPNWSEDQKTRCWWAEQEGTNYAELKDALAELLSGPLHVHREQKDDADAAIRTGMKNPVLVCRKAICVWTPPKTSYAPK
jgi:hypothetical protein